MNRILNLKFIEYYKEGISLRQISKITGIDRKKIAHYLEKIGIKKKEKKWNTGLNKYNCKKLMEMSIKISNAENGRKFTNEHKEKIGYKNRIRKIKEETKKKQRLNRLGKKNPKQAIRMKLNNPMKIEALRENASKRLSGKNSPFWIEGIINRKYKNFTSIFKNKIRKRDNQVCMLCGIHREKLYRALDVHHINYDKHLTIKENCISLCKSCHTKTHFNRLHWTKFFQSLLSERYGYKYSEQLEPILTL